MPNQECKQMLVSIDLSIFAELSSPQWSKIQGHVETKKAFVANCEYSYLKMVSQTITQLMPFFRVVPAKHNLTQSTAVLDVIDIDFYPFPVIYQRQKYLVRFSFGKQQITSKYVFQ